MNTTITNKNFKIFAYYARNKLINCFRQKKKKLLFAQQIIS